MARKISYQQAINEALEQEMRRDPTVFLMGEDNAGGAGAPGEQDAWGGVLGVTKGLYHKFPGRVLDTPLSEIGYVGAAVGAAARGTRPVCELMFVDFAGCCLDQIQAIRDNDPVIFCEHKLLYGMQGEVPEESYAIPFGEASFLREGDDVSLITYGRMVHLAMDAAANLARQGVSCEVLDLRTTSPLDRDSILESVEKTGRAVVIDEANPRCSVATDIAALLAEQAFDDLRAPVQLVTAPHTPVPFSDALEDLYIPDAAKIERAVLKITQGRQAA